MGPAWLPRGVQRSVAGSGGSAPRPLDGVTTPSSNCRLQLVGWRWLTPGRVEVTEVHDISVGSPASRPVGAGRGFGAAPLTRSHLRRSGSRGGLPEEDLPGGACWGGGALMGGAAAVQASVGRRIGGGGGGAPAGGGGLHRPPTGVDGQMDRHGHNPRKADTRTTQHG
jgi:hypothetical protein